MSKVFYSISYLCLDAYFKKLLYIILKCLDAFIKLKLLKRPS